jgi:ABC-type polysaccharide/polyol phosphate transport system ATPase subunit
MEELIKSDKTVVMASHMLRPLRALADRALWIEEGVVRESGPAGDVLNHYLEHQRAQ